MPSMELYAAALKLEQPATTWSADKHAQYSQDVRAVARVLAGDNPCFDYERFFAAAGLVRTGPADLYHSVHEHSSACGCNQG